MSPETTGTLGQTDDSDGPQSREIVPDVVETPRAKLVYHYVRAADGASADRICQALEMPRLSVLPVLSTLTRRGVLEDDGEEYVVADWPS
jgi:hypothetical protein